MNIAAYLLIAALVAGAGAFGVHTYNNAIERAKNAETERDNWKVNAEAQASINADLKAEKAKLSEALAVRQAVRNTRGEITRKVEDALTKARNDAQVREWGATPVPQSVVDSLRLDSRGASAAAKGMPRAGGEPARAGAGSGVAGANDERTVAQPRPGVSGGGAGVQRGQRSDPGSR